MNTKPTYEELERHVASLEKQLRQSQHDHKRLEAENRARLKSYQAILKSVPHPITITRLDNGRYLMVNPAFTRQTGFSETEVIGHSVTELGIYTHPANRDRVLSAIKKHKHIEGLQIKFRAKNGSVGYNLMSMQLIQFNGVQCILSIATNITPFRRAQEALKKSEEQYRVLVENANEGILIAQDEWVRFANSKMEAISGYSEAELKARAFVNFIHTEDRQMVLERHQKRMAGEDVVEHYRFRLLTPAGDHPWVEIRAVKVSWEGKPAIMCMLSDITPQMEALEALRQSEEASRNILETAPDAIVIIDRNDGRFLQVNNAFCKNTGNPREEVLGRTAIELGLYEDPTQRKELTRILNRQGFVDGFEVTFKAHNGALIHDLVSARPIQYEGHDCILLIAKNINTLKQAQKALSDSEARYRNILESMQEGYYELDLKGNFTFFNNALIGIYGYPSNELRGRNYRTYTSSETAERLFTIFNKIYNSQETVRIVDYQAFRKDGKEITIETSAALLYDPQGAPTGFYGVCRDRTEQKMAERALRQSEENNRMILALAPDSISISSLADGRFLQVNQAFCELSGHSEKEVIGRTVRDLNIYEEVAERQTIIDALKQDGQVSGMEIHFRHKNGTPIICLISARPVHYQGEACLLSVVTDITSLSQARQKLARSEAKYRTILGNMAEGYYEVDRDGNFLFFNDAFVRMLGYSKEELTGTNFRQYAPSPEAADAVLNAYQEIFKSGEKHRVVEFEAVRKDGRRILFEASASNLRNTDGQKIGFYGVCRDRTEKVEAEKALCASEESLRITLNSIGDAVIATDITGCVVRMNPVAEKLTGWTMTQAIGEPLQKVFQIINEITNAPLENPVQKVLQEGRIIGMDRQTLLVAKNGKRIPISDSAAPMMDEDGRIIGAVMVFRDVTQRRKAENALRESEEKYRLLVDNANEGIFINQDDSMKFANDRLEVLTGYDSLELESLKLGDLIYGDDKKLYNQYLDKRNPQKPSELYGFRLIQKNKETCWVDLNSVPISWEGRPASLNFIRDITHQKKIEAQLLQAQKMRAVGTLAGGIAHDFNNLLMGIQGNTSLMMLDISPEDPKRDKLVHIEEFVKAGVNLTKQLLGIAKGGKYEVKAVNINTIIADSAELFGRTRKEISIHQRLQEDLLAVKADKNQIQQVLLNLFVNAWHAMPTGGELIIESKNVFLDAFYTKSYGLAAGQFVRISVTDTGSGMDEVTRKRVFDPFFTTKEMGRGTGLGLASAYGIISNHNGIINVYSEEGQGSTFNIYLPVTQQPPEAQPLAHTEEIVTGSETILLVDDEETIVEIGAEILERLGYRVLTALSGREALEVYTRHQDQIELVILDMIMPRMNGGETFDELKKLNPDVQVLLSSGYSLNGQAQTIMERGCTGFIQKPFSVPALSEKMRQILDKKRQGAG